MNLLGPNADQVERFVEQISKLSRQQWWQIKDKEALAREAHGNADLQTAEEFYGKDSVDLWIREGVRRVDVLSLTETYDAAIYFQALRAIFALTVCGGLSQCAFRANYGAFADIIPVSGLGEGLAPEVNPLPNSQYGLFLSRVGCLDGRNWNDVLTIAEVQSVAMGDAIDSHYQRATDVLLLKTEEEDFDKSEALLMVNAINSIDQLVFEGFSNVRLGWHLVGKAQDKTVLEVANEYAGAFGPREDFARYLLKQALIAIMTREAITEPEFASLYLPFATVIPLR